MAVTDFDIAAQMRHGDGDGLRGFFLVHTMLHQQNADAISLAQSVAVPTFDVEDERARAEWELLMIDPEKVPKGAAGALQSWLLLHQQLHQAEYDVIGYGVAPDLSTVDFASKEQFEIWMLEHQQMHDQVAQTLGIS